MSYKFRIAEIPEVFNNNEVFNSHQFWDYLKSIKLNVCSINIYNVENNFLGYVITTKRKVGFFSFYGSPVRGVGTDFQGISLLTDVSNTEKKVILEKFIEFIEKINFTPFRILQNDFPIELFSNKDWILKKNNRYILDLRKSEEEIKSGYSYKSATYEINKAKKRGLYVQFIDNVNDFLNIHFEHLSDVFSRKGIPNPHSFKRLFALLNSLNKSQYLLSIIFNLQGKPIASNIYLIGQKFSYYYTGASLSLYFKDSPNELLMSESILELKRRGVELLEFGRGMDYKKKYGPTEKEFVEVYSRQGFWKVEFAEFVEYYLKKLRKNKLYKILLAKQVNRLLHYSN